MPKNNSQYERMTKWPVPLLILFLGFPTMVSMFVTTIYNMADSYFVGKINTSASGATSVVMGSRMRKHNKQKARREGYRQREKLLGNGFLSCSVLRNRHDGLRQHLSHASHASSGQYRHHSPLCENLCDMHSLRRSRAGIKLRNE